MIKKTVDLISSDENQHNNYHQYNNYQCDNNFYHYVSEKYGLFQRNPDGTLKTPEAKEYEWGALPELFCKTTTLRLKIINEMLNKNDNERSDDEKMLCTVWEASQKRNNCDSISRELEILDAYLIPDLQILDIIDLVHRITEYIHYARTNNINNILDINLINLSTIEIKPQTMLVHHQGIEFVEHLEQIRTIINDNTTIYLDDLFVQNVIEFESEINDTEPNEIDDVILTKFYEKLNELFNSSTCTIVNTTTKKILSIIFDPMNTQKYRSYIQYQIIKRYAFTCIDLIDNKIFEFYNKSIKHRPPKLKSLDILNKYFGELLNQICIINNLQLKDKSEINMIIFEILKHFDNKVIIIPGITDNENNTQRVLIDNTHSLYEIDKLLQNNIMVQSLINVLHNDNKFIFSVPLFQPPYYSYIHNNMDLCINFGGIGIFILFQIMDDSLFIQRITGCKINKIISMMEKCIDGMFENNEFGSMFSKALYQTQDQDQHQDQDQDQELLRLIKDISSMINALNLSTSILTRILEETETYDKILLHKKVFFESYACAHIHNTRKYMISGKEIKLTGEFWVNIVNSLDEFSNTYKNKN